MSTFAAQPTVGKKRIGENMKKINFLGVIGLCILLCTACIQHMNDMSKVDKIIENKVRIENNITNTYDAITNDYIQEIKTEYCNTNIVSNFILGESVTITEKYDQSSNLSEYIFGGIDGQQIKQYTYNKKRKVIASIEKLRGVINETNCYEYKYNARDQLIEKVRTNFTGKPNTVSQFMQKENYEYYKDGKLKATITLYDDKSIEIIKYEYTYKKE